MVLAKSCGIILVCAALAIQLGCKEPSLVQRLREWCYGAKDKHGSKRRELDVSSCFAPLLGWILSWWPADEPCLALALDATTLKKRGTRAVYQRGLSWLCHSGGLENRRSGGKRLLATALDGIADAHPRGGAAGVDGDRDSGSRVVRAFALPQDRVVGVASIHAHQQAGQFPPARAREVSQSGQCRPRGGQRLVWESRLLFWRNQSFAVYAAGA